MTHLTLFIDPPMADLPLLLTNWVGLGMATLAPAPLIPLGSFLAPAPLLPIKAFRLRLLVHGPGLLVQLGLAHLLINMGRYCSTQCCGSMKFWYGFGSADPYIWLIDPDVDPDPAIFVSDLQDVNKKQIFENNFFLLITFWRYIYIIFQR